MNSLIRVATTMAVVLFSGFFCVLAWKMATGGISLGYLLDGDVQDPDDPSEFSTQPSAGRVQAFVTTLIVAGYYLLQVIHNPRVFPKLPNAMVGALAGSHTLYLAGKAQAMLSDRIRDWFK
jgi:hypothetical protein